jgi:hypothetical protein
VAQSRQPPSSPRTGRPRPKRRSLVSRVPRR